MDRGQEVIHLLVSICNSVCIKSMTSMILRCYMNAQINTVAYKHYTSATKVRFIIIGPAHKLVSNSKLTDVLPNQIGLYHAVN